MALQARSANPLQPLKHALLSRLGRLVATQRVHWLLFLAIVAVGVFARTWEYGALPPSVFSDEASIGVDSYYIGRYGIDRNGISYPTQLVAFGQEQNALYAYLIMPLIMVWGLRPVVIRLPMLISAILTLPLVYVLARRMFSARLGLLCMFFLAISPWHIMLARWGLDQNLLVFVLTLAVACLLEASRSGKWLVASCFLFGLCFYIYGPSYFIVPIVLGISLWLIWKRRLASRTSIWTGLAVFAVMALPITIFLLINTLKLPSVHLGLVTIPRMPSTPRFLSQAGGLGAALPTTLAGNLWNFIRILVGQTDGLVYNAIEPFGYFYKVTFPLAVLGIILLYRLQRKERDIAKTVLFVWISACLVFGVLQQVNINRINAIFIPLILCTALAIDWLGQRWRLLYVAALVGLAAGFVWFTVVYHGAAYRAVIDNKFHKGFLPAVHYAAGLTTGAICITGKVDQPYIYVLFSEKPDPHTVVDTIQYRLPEAELRTARSLTRYIFGTQSCAAGDSSVYVLTAQELPPHFGRRYAFKYFDQFVVYYAKP